MTTEMKQLSLVLAWAVALLLAACSEPIRVSGHCDVVPQLVPDYADVTIPCNIAPLSFGVEGMEEAALVIAGRNDSICFTTQDGCFNPSARAWRRLLEQEKGHALRLTICRPSAEGWEAMKPVELRVSNDSIDPYLVYRRITPGYGLWNRMGIYQRCLENYDETPLYENRYGRGNCVNCHSFCEGNPERWQVHVRYRQAGTYIFDGLEQQKLKLQNPSQGKPVYANWHPEGRMVAYSTNATFFLIHTRKANRWEVMDDRSDVMVTDVETGQSYSAPQIASEESLETWPCFSPDGHWLYFCTAKAPVDNAVIERYDSIRYSLCRIAFDATTCTFGQRVDTLYNAEEDGGSASLPRVSPDGRWLCFVRSAYGNFSICHRDADLCMIDLKDEHRGIICQPDANSAEHVDSWHSWSRNSRWLVVSSKRGDGIYTRPYLTHVGEDGTLSKAFVLPQKNAPAAYDLEMDCCNLPELVTGPVRGRLHPSNDGAQPVMESGVN